MWKWTGLDVPQDSGLDWIAHRCLTLVELLLD
jgi:hypothetical protein